MRRRDFLAATASVLGMVVTGATNSAGQEADPLPSWNAGAVKQRLAEFLTRTTTPGDPWFVEPADRIAVFDNDGTLWCEQPMYVQAAFAFDRLTTLAMSEPRPEWVGEEPWKSLLAGRPEAFRAAGARGIMELVLKTHAHVTEDEFAEIVARWIQGARHPRFERPYTECVYQPMLELLALARARGYQTFIVSGGGIDFMRPWTERVYGIPRHQVVGSGVKLRYELRDETPVLARLPQIDFIDDKEEKPVGIQRHIGRRPVLCCGNSDGDYAMLRYTTAGTGPRLGLIVHHTDADREYAYDRESPVGQLRRALDEAPQRGWLVADMRRDWGAVFPPVAR